jgi:hypothetical protein
MQIRTPDAVFQFQGEGSSVESVLCRNEPNGGRPCGCGADRGDRFGDWSTTSALFSATHSRNTVVLGGAHCDGSKTL